MIETVPIQFEAKSEGASPSPHILVGITNPQTCLILSTRLRAFCIAGFQVSLVSAPGELLDSFGQDETVHTIEIPMERKISPFADLLSLIRLWRLLGRTKPDLVEFSTPKAGLLGSLAAKLRGVPVRVYLLRGLKLEACRGLKRRVLLVAERIAAACSHIVLCNSESLRDEVRALGIAPTQKLMVLGDGSSNGVDLARFSPGCSDIRSKLAIPLNAPVLGFVGRLTCDKGLPELIEAFAMILKTQPGAYLLLVGWFDAAEDALQVGIRARIESHPRIVCTGLVANTAPYYRAMDMLILPSWREGFPNVALEAAATGIPVITTFSTGSRDAVIPEVTGLLVPPGYPEAIREAVLQLIKNPEKRRRMGSAARLWAIEHYAEQRVLGLTVKLYKSLLSQRLRNNLPASNDEAELIKDLSLSQ